MTQSRMQRIDPRVPEVGGWSRSSPRSRKQGTPVWVQMPATDEGHGFGKKKNADYLFYATVQFVQGLLVEVGPAGVSAFIAAEAAPPHLGFLPQAVLEARHVAFAAASVNLGRKRFRNRADRAPIIGRNRCRTSPLRPYPVFRPDAVRLRAGPRRPTEHRGIKLDSNRVDKEDCRHPFGILQDIPRVDHRRNCLLNRSRCPLEDLSPVAQNPDLPIPDHHSF